MDKIDLLCPACGSENTEIARKKEKKSHIYKFQMEDLAYVPKKKLSKSMKCLIVLGVALGIVLIVLLTGYLKDVKRTADQSLDKQENRIKKLEGHYDAGEYEAMYTYLLEIKEYGNQYEKYYRIGEASKRMDEYIGELEQICQEIDGNAVDADELAVALASVLEELNLLKQWNADGYIYDEEAGAEYLSEEYRDCLKTTLLLKESEIDYAIIQYKETGSCTETAGLAVGRICEK